MSGRLTVSEIFGPTFQGEGPSLGRRAGFVRLGRCNLDCSWCDTAYTWDWERYDPAVELTARDVDDVVAELERMAVDLVVVTGGEPLLQRRHLGDLARACRDRGWTVEVETNGTLDPGPKLVAAVDRWNVSPKLSGSGVAAERRLRPEVLRVLEASGRAVFKFVVGDRAELAEVAALVSTAGLGEVWVMAEGTDAASVVAGTAALAPEVLARGWNLTTRLHVLIWGDRRGV